MSDREPLSYRLVEAVESRLRRHAPVVALRVAYRVGYVVLRPWWYLTRPQTQGVKVVVRCGDEVLLVRHSYARRGQWDLPGGFVHPGEDPEVALRRELSEELGVTPLATRRIACTPSRLDGKREVLFTYLAEVADTTIDPSPAEIDQARWYPVDALPVPATRLARQMSARSAWEHGPDDD
ncbi:NUDIX hydrolase [Baekduia soli]|uniref:NUDIX hydrolase n=1 Tax=Baekduia soli TaxID=496014 RepID=A0A5B8U3Q2_9ACTN|nr:NUDIX hydrolase [Baekduia soli]QEC47643.1 NUDIX hydrolase [Baekduia soli]